VKEEETVGEAENEPIIVAGCLALITLSQGGRGHSLPGHTDGTFLGGPEGRLPHLVRCTSGFQRATSEAAFRACILSRCNKSQ
jgi:hypothetical protein